MDYLDYTNEDKWDLEKACLAALNPHSRTLGMLYDDLVDGNHVFHKFKESRHIAAGPFLLRRVHEEKKKLSQALQRLRRRKLVELYVGYSNMSHWRLTPKGMEALSLSRKTKSVGLVAD